MRSRRVSIRTLAAWFVVGPVVLVAGALLLLGSATTDQVVAKMGSALVRDSSVRVAERVHDYLQDAVRVSDLYARRLADGTLPTLDLSSWDKLLLEDLATSPRVASICFGNERGDAVWLLRHGSRLETGRADGQAGGAAIEFALDAGGRPAGPPLREYTYDPRARPWYAVARERGKPSWTPIYFWFGDSGGDAELGAGYTRTIVSADGARQGVLVIDVTLAALSAYLRSIRTEEAGITFIVDEHGELVASSDGRVTSTDGRRLGAADAANELIRATYAALPRDGAPGAPDVASGAYRLTLPIGACRAGVAAVSPYPGLSWHVVSVVPEATLLAEARTTEQRGRAIALITLLASVLGAFMLSGRVVRPLQALRSHVGRIAGGDLDARLDLRAARELEELSLALNEMAAGLKERVQLRHALELADAVQQRLLPLAAPRVPGLEISGDSRYCDATGGDYYDFIEFAGLGDRQMLVAVGDVTGHGVAAALMMATARAALRATAREAGSLGAILTRVNQVYGADLERARFMTLLLLVADPEKRCIRWSSAGHDAPLLYEPGPNAFRELPEGSLPLGIMEEVTYEERSAEHLAPNALLVVGTDGIWEAMDKQGELFRKERLREVIRANAARSVDEVGAAIRDAVAAHLQGQALQDDVTFVVIRFTA